MRCRQLQIIVLLSAAACGQQVSFIPVSGPNTPEGACYLLLDKVRGGMWMGGMVEGTEGLTYFDGSHFFPTLPARFPKVLVMAMAEDDDGGIWLATNAGIYRVFQAKVELVGAGVSGSVTQAAKHVMVATLTKTGTNVINLVRLSKDSAGKWESEVVAAVDKNVTLQPDQSGNIVFTCTGGYCQFRAGDIVKWRRGGELPVVRHLDPSLSPDSRGSTDPSALFKDRFGCFWLADSTGQVRSRCPADSIATIDAAEPGFPSISELSDGSILIPFFSKLAIGRPGHLRMITSANGYPGAMSAVITGEGTTWFGSGNGIPLAMPNGMRIEYWTGRDGLVGNTWSVARTSRNTFAVAGTTLMVLKSDRSGWSPLRRGSIDTRFQTDSSGNLFEVSGTGRRPLNRDGAAIGKAIPIQGGECEELLEKAGWERLVGVLQQQCISYSANGQNTLLYSDREREGGFTLLETTAGSQPVLHRFSSGGGIGNATVRFLGIDGRGWIWRGSPQGIYVADPQQVRQGKWLHLDQSDGLDGKDANRGSFFSDPDGSVWFGIDNSINHVYPSADLVHPQNVPDVFISGYASGNAQPQIADMVTQFKSKDTVTALIGTLDYQRRSAVHIRYRLLPRQVDWQEATDRDITLGTPSWGDHALEVQGRVFTGPWSSTVSRSFTVLRPAGLSAPFLASYAAAALAMVGLIEWRRRKRVSDEANLLPDLGDWRFDALEPEVHPLTGTTLSNRYEVGKLLARGGFASVLSGYDRSHGRPCAIKVFRGEVKDKPSMRQGFEQEITALRRIKHPNVVSIYADGETSSGSPYMVMEFIEGSNLRDILSNGPLSTARTGILLDGLAKALDAIHAQGICHRDVKPENVIVRRTQNSEQAVLIDFSIAIIKDVNETLHGISRAAGTFDYMAPEQALGHAQPSSDIFSLAKLVIEMLGGVRVSERLPNAALDLPAQVMEMLKTWQTPLSEESRHMLAGALAFDPSQRPNVATVFARPILRDLAAVGMHTSGTS